jgi:hypothetical protein
MANAGRPTGPTQPTHLEREDADEREQVSDALGGPDMASGHHGGKIGRHTPSSPKVGTADSPAGDGDGDGDGEDGGRPSS